MARIIDRVGRATRQIAGDDTLIGTIVTVVILLLFLGSIVAISVYDRQEGLETAIKEARQAARNNGAVLSFMQGCTIPEDQEHIHPPGNDQHDHKCFEDQQLRTALAVRSAAVETECRVRRALRNLGPLPFGVDCAVQAKQ